MMVIKLAGTAVDDVRTVLSHTVGKRVTVRPKDGKPITGTLYHVADGGRIRFVVSARPRCNDPHVIRNEDMVEESS